MGTRIRKLTSILRRSISCWTARWCVRRGWRPYTETRYAVPCIQASNAIDLVLPWARCLPPASVVCLAVDCICPLTAQLSHQDAFPFSGLPDHLSRPHLTLTQNTHIYGKVLKEGPHAGCWVHPDTGKQAEGAIGVDPGRFSWAKGIFGAVQRVRGAGGF